MNASLISDMTEGKVNHSIGVRAVPTTSCGKRGEEVNAPIAVMANAARIILARIEYAKTAPKDYLWQARKNGEPM